MSNGPIELDLDTTSIDFPDLSGEGEIAMTGLLSDEQEVGLAKRKNLGELITKFGLQEREEDFPATHKEAQAQADENPSDIFDYEELNEGVYTCLNLPAFRKAIRLLTGGGNYDAEDFTLWRPTRPVEHGDSENFGPWVIESDRTPVEWFRYRAFGGESQFRHEYGVESCERCDSHFDETVIDCPECETYPPQVWEYVEAMQDEYDGVLCLIMPKFPDPGEKNKLEDDPEVDMREAIQQYKDKTGDVNLVREDQLDEFLAERGVM